MLSEKIDRSPLTTRKTPSKGLKIAQLIIAFAKRQGDKGVTLEECHAMLRAMGFADYNTNSPRFHEITSEAKILVPKDGHDRPTKKGVNAQVWVLRPGATVFDYANRPRRKTAEKTDDETAVLVAYRQL